MSHTVIPLHRLRLLDCGPMHSTILQGAVMDNGQVVWQDVPRVHLWDIQKNFPSLTVEECVKKDF